ncbi:probable indole-3-pyruvate monooxygenase YUCCA11 [Impatiens glandulifera]|uniref:probable indole-3-pyruvate monooxygenase YUCCA11 n=1 Tax=Impatiens glandulifera TaxID=253017 RepID=UPI001FB07E9D|nr:probable indole-3-pyruvate monooxygenase YUCCA11 [Impatiens glandulifera]
MEILDTVVIIVGAGPGGMATSACLNLLSIPNIVIEREDCCASLWKKKAYDRLKLHLAKDICKLPHMPFPPTAPTYVLRNDFIAYLDNYVSQFNIEPFYRHNVMSAFHDRTHDKWIVHAEDMDTGVKRTFMGMFLVVATGINSQGVIPKIDGMSNFGGTVLHSSQYKNGKIFEDKDVLVVGCGNSGMEIAYDLSNYYARCSIVVRSPVHVLSKELVKSGMYMMKIFSPKFVDDLIVLISKFMFGNLSKYGFHRPNKGPFYLKTHTGRSPIIDVGTIGKIKKGIIKVVPTISKVLNEKNIEFTNGTVKSYAGIVFATGYKSTVNTWLQDDGALFDGNGMPKKDLPNYWKGKNNLYCVGFSSGGLFGIYKDSINISQDIKTIFLDMSKQ